MEHLFGLLGFINNLDPNKKMIIDMIVDSVSIFINHHFEDLDDIHLSIFSYMYSSNQHHQLLELYQH